MTIYQFIEFEGEQATHDAWESIEGNKALIERIQRVDRANGLNYVARDEDGRSFVYDPDRKQFLER